MNRSRRLFVIIVTTIVVPCGLVLLVATFWPLLVLGADFLLAPRADYPMFESTVAKLDSGALTPDALGVVTLPANLQDQTVDGCVYVTRGPGTTLQVLFPTWRGKGANVCGYLYSSSSLSPPQNIVITAPSIAPPDQRMLMLNRQWAGSVEVVVEQREQANWYFVSRSLD